MNLSSIRSTIVVERILKNEPKNHVFLAKNESTIFIQGILIVNEKTACIFVVLSERECFQI